MTTWEENEIRRQFRQLQHDDTNRAPRFARSWDEATSQVADSTRGPQWKVRYGSLTFASLLVVSGALAWLRMLPADAPPVPDLQGIRLATAEWSTSIDQPFAIAALSQWQSPTHFLLKRPYDVSLSPSSMN